jgi:VanZ family protein
MFLRYNLPGIIWGMIVFVLLAMPGSDVPKLSFLHFLPMDKIVHFILFSVFSFLLSFGFLRQCSFQRLRLNAMIVAFFISVIYGGVMEYLQGTVFVDRTSDWFDFIMNLCGTIGGLFTFALLKTKIISKFSVKIPKANTR